MKTEKRISNYVSATAPAKRGAARKTALAKQDAIYADAAENHSAGSLAKSKQDAARQAAAKGASQAPSKAYVRLSPGELRTLVAAAQRFEQPAIDKLCAAFEPLVYKEAHNKNIIKILGDDAVNTAWESFLDFVQRYDKKSYRRFSSLARINLRYELLHKAFRNNSVQDSAVLDETDEDGRRLINPSDKNALMNGLHEKKFAEDLLTKLSEKQREIIVATVIEGYTLEEFARAKGINSACAYRLRKRGLALLRAKLQ